MKRIFHPFYVLLIIGSLSAFLVSCGSDDNGSEPTPTLSITAIEPLTARAGDTIRITGKGFSTTPSQNTVLFNQSATASAQVISATGEELKVKVPAAAPNGPIKVTVGSESAVSAQSFTLNTSLSAPAITAINPTHGLAGVEITLTGTNLVEGTVIPKVSFGTTQADIVGTPSATSIKVKVPTSLAEGSVDVRIDRGGQLSNIVKFTVDPLPKTVRATYWTDGTSIFKGTITETGVNIETLYGAEDNVSKAFGIVFNPTDNNIYFVGTVRGVTGGRIFRAPADGSGPIEKLYNVTELGGSTAVYDIALDIANSTLYITAVGDGKDQIIKGNYGNLSEPTKAIYDIASSGGEAIGIKLTVANGKIYWTESVSKRVVEGNLDGSQPAKVLFDESEGLAFPYNIAVDVANQKIFILDNPESGATATDAIYSGNLDGSGALTAIISAGADLEGGNDIEVDTQNQYVIWLTRAEGGQGQKVSRCKYDGKGIETLFSSDQIVSAGFFDIDVR